VLTRKGEPLYPRRERAAVLSVRPKVAELVYQLYRRALHPELFEVCSTGTVKRAEYEAKIDITSTGHVVTWRHADITLTEVATSAHHPLVERGRLRAFRLKGQRSDRLEYQGVVCHLNFSLEPVEPEIFWAFHEELTRDGRKRGMLQRFGSNGRMALGALSYVNVETRARSFLVQTFHTFPDDYAIVKSQSLFQLPHVS
jgi:hypothetical protein